MSDFKIGNELVQRQNGSAANVIRKISELNSYTVYFEDGVTVTRREIENSGKWSLLTLIRSSKSKVETGDTVHFRDKLGSVRHRDGEFAYFLAKEHEKIPLSEIHYDTDANEFWYLNPLDVRSGDIVIYSNYRLKVETVDLTTNQIIFTDGFWVSRNQILVDAEERNYYISELDNLEKPINTEPTLKEGDFVYHKSWKFEVLFIKDGIAHFMNQGEFPVEKMKYFNDCWQINPTIPFYDIEVPKTGIYWLLADKCDQALTEKLRYAYKMGYKLWGPTLVKGDHYSQAMRK